MSVAERGKTEMPRCKCGAHDWHPIHKKSRDNSWMYHEYEPWPEAIDEFVRQLEFLIDEGR